MQSSIGDRKNSELGYESDGEPLKSNLKWCHMRFFEGPGLEFGGSALDHV